ncbi:undecaprenyl/decaprenyl-phosphate alpha-N-acetylglucosaminyl 1-phosphate transferase, partial [Patescibacteria group bacterium]|nr:undecaprenyl/decaprenyl-phosphate alpha-N-acetylglucosaminyl 1-phosphate transferase [Patescibacteria group bacterium]
GGALDDRFNLRARYSIIFPFFAVLVAVMAGIGVSKITNPLGGALYVLPWVSMLLSFLWLMGMTYTTKLLDGLDGLATGVSAIAVFIIGILALTQTYYQPDAALFAFVIFAALIGFLLWNFYPAQIFLGESGSTFIGYSIGVLAIIAGGKMATALLVLGIPALDIIFVIVDRARMKQPLFAGDRRHLHHKLLDIGLSQKGVVFLYYGIAMIVGITSLMFESIGKILAFFVLFIIMVIGTFFVSRLKKNYVI